MSFIFLHLPVSGIVKCICYCVSELHGHICPYHNVWPEAVLQELHCLPNCLHDCMMTVRGCYHSIKFHCPTPSGF